jgi:hypothetical protein
MRQEYHFPKLSKAEQLECMKELQPLVEYCRANRLNRIPRELLIKPENRKALAAKQKLTLSLCSMIASIAMKVGINKSQINEVVSHVQPAIDKCIVAFDFSHGSAFSSFVYLRIFGECVSFAKANNKHQETLVEDISVFGEHEVSAWSVNLANLDSQDITLLDAIFRFSEKDGKVCGSIHDLVDSGLIPSQPLVDKILGKLGNDR